METRVVKTITEPARDVPVIREADVIVVGGGPAGIAAATAASRNGTDTVLIERYGHLGGLATGGLVVLIMPMSGGTETQQIAGICQELVERLDNQGGALHPKLEELGSVTPRVVDRWRPYPFFVVENRVRYSALFDPEIMKCVLNEMVEGAGVKLFLHSWISSVIMDEGCVKGIIFESKSGRKAVLGRVIIDTTGDGDVFSLSDAEFDDTTDPGLRSSTQALVFRLGHVDVDKFIAFKSAEPQKWGTVLAGLKEIDSFPLMPFPSWRKDVVWVNNWIPGYNSLNVEDLTDVEVRVRKVMPAAHDLLKREVPGFENSYIMDTASQLGIRVGRRLTGEYVLTKEDIRSGKIFDDTIAVCPPFHAHLSAENPNMYIPYRSLLPRRVDGLLAAGRCFSADPVANDILSPIQSCIAMGQAAGTAASISVKDNVQPRDIDLQSLRGSLIDQNVWLP